MALSKNIIMNVKYVSTIRLEENMEIIQPLQIDGAYIMVDEIIGTKEDLSFKVKVYKTIQKEQFLYEKDYTFKPNVEDNSPNFIQQAYEYLKTLPEYENALDC